MNFEQATERMKFLSRLPAEDQEAPDFKQEIPVVFELFWRSNPKQTTFADVTAGLKLTNEMVYIMVKKG